MNMQKKHSEILERLGERREKEEVKEEGRNAIGDQMRAT